MAEITIAEKQYLAKILFSVEKLDQKICAKKVGVSEKTMSKWVNEFGWKNLRRRLLVTKEEQLSNLFEQLEELNTTIKQKEPGKRFADTKQADIQIKLTASIKNLENDLGIADLMESGRRFIKHLQTIASLQQTQEIAELWNVFLMASVKK
jgi:hypothetical protein